MKVLKFFPVLIFLAIASVFICGLFLPSSLNINHYLVIEYNLDTIFESVVDLKKRLEWSAWSEEYPDATVSYSSSEGITSGEGASFVWKRGSDVIHLSIVSVIKNFYVKDLVSFGEGSKSIVEWKFHSIEEDKIRVEFSLKRSYGLNIFHRYISYFYLESYLRKQAQTNLKNLEKYVLSSSQK